MGAEDHRDQARGTQAARGAILTVSDTRTPQDDRSGRAAFEILARFGHSVALHEIVPNDRKQVAAGLEKALREADVVVTIGGTGASRKDLTVEAVRPRLAKELPGFGEAFRAASAREIGSAAMLSRAVLGVTEEGKVVVALPGSEGAVRLGLGMLMDELGHLLWELRRYS